MSFKALLAGEPIPELRLFGLGEVRDEVIFVSQRCAPLE
jgi:hypothetical protein